MSWLRQRADNSLGLGVGLHPDGVSIAKVKYGKKGPPKLLECQFVAAEGEAQQQRELVRISRELKLKNLPASVVLAPGSYSLLQVERPEVQDDEVRSAIRWRIKDLIDFHIDDAVLDLFDLPEGSRAGAPRLMFVVAARIAAVQQVVDMLKAAAIPIASIDITELALRNLLACCGSDEEFRALLYLAPDYGMIEIVRGSVLYLNRRIEISAEDLQQQGAGLIELMDTLVLELQRSLDYHESQFGAGPVTSVAVIGPEQGTDQLTAFAGENLGAEVKRLLLGEGLEVVTEITVGQLDRCLPVVGAALRVR